MDSCISESIPGNALPHCEARRLMRGEKATLGSRELRPGECDERTRTFRYLSLIHFKTAMQYVLGRYATTLTSALAGLSTSPTSTRQRSPARASTTCPFSSNEDSTSTPRSKDTTEPS